MKIFFDDRYLILLKPEEAFDGQIVVPGSAEEMKQMVSDFEKDQNIKVLAVSAPGYKQLKRDVKTLFTIVKAAGGVVKNEAGEILFIHRRGRWDLPKGKIDTRHAIRDTRYANGETRMAKRETRNPKRETRNAKPETRNPKLEWRKAEAVREVMEETGIRKVKVVGKLKPTYHFYREKGEPMLKKSFWFEMSAPKDQKLVPQTSEDIRYVRWFPLEELDTVLDNTFGSLREMIERLRR